MRTAEELAAEYDEIISVTEASVIDETTVAVVDKQPENVKTFYNPGWRVGLQLRMDDRRTLFVFVPQVSEDD